MVYDVAFQRLRGTVEQYGVDASEGMHSVICDPPYITPLIAEFSNLER